MSLADKSRMDALEERIAALEAKLKEIDARLQAQIAALRQPTVAKGFYAKRGS